MNTAETMEPLERAAVREPVGSNGKNSEPTPPRRSGLRKTITAVVVIAIAALVIYGVKTTLENNKAKSEATVKSVVVKPTTVAVAPLGYREIEENVSLVGTIIPNREVTVGSETLGRIIALNAEVGHTVGRGATVARLETDQRVTALQSAQAAYDRAQQDLARFEIVQQENALPQQQIDNAKIALRSAALQVKLARQQLADTRVIAPFSGVVDAKLAEVGAIVQPGTPIAKIVDISVLKVRVNVPEAQVFQLKVGDRVDVSTDVYPGVTFNGRISSIGAKADEAHTYPVEVTVSNDRVNPLKAGMFARVEFNSGALRRALAVPRLAVIGGAKEPGVFVVNNGVAQLRKVTIGAEIGSDVEIVNGLVPGDQIIVVGQNNVTSGMKVTVTQAPAQTAAK